MRKFTSYAAAVAALLILTPEWAWTWDQHHLLTSQLLLAFKERDAALWGRLDSLVPVTPIEEFLTRAFGPSCNWAAAKDTVFGGVGRDYNVLFVDGVSYTQDVVWDKAITWQRTHAIVDPNSNQVVGRLARAADVLAIYSDEPDWGLDDDVQRLRGKGVSQAGEGVATRMLRHFWYQGERIGGVDFGKDQETDKRAQLYYELALVAFAGGEPYWGYRFLADSLHYLQDVTQPFHSRAILTGAMVDLLGVLRAKLCEWHPRPDCTPDLTLDAQVIHNGWIVAAYHTTYEDFVRGLLSPGFPYSSYDFLRDTNGWHERNDGVEALPWRGAGPLLDLTQVIPAEQRAINVNAESFGDAAYNSFGTKIRYDLATTQRTIQLTSQDQSEGFRIALVDNSSDHGVTLTGRQWKALPNLVARTHQLLLRAGVWSRQLVEQTLAETEAEAESGNARLGAEIEKLRDKFERSCATGALAGP